MNIVRTRSSAASRVVPGSLPVAPSRPRGSPLARLVADVDHATTSASGEAAQRVVAALKPYLRAADLLDGVACPSSPDRYMRYLLHASASYTVLALVWRPGQMSPVHGHRAWGVVGVHRGWLVEALFMPAHGTLRPYACHQRHPGQILPISHDATGIHRIANLGTEEAISIHVYNTQYDQLGTGLNVIWAE